MQKYCYNCMKQLEDSPVCKRCGYNNETKTNTAPYHMLPGSTLNNKYLVGNVLGEGGFGITYIGLDTILSKRVAIKEFYPSGAANRTNAVSEEVVITKGKEAFFEKGVERFLFEAKNVAAFYDEEGVVDVLDYFQANGTAYIVMEFVDGETLKHHVNTKGRFDAQQLINLLQPVMRSLSYMHKQGIIHRDISPDNIMLTKRGKMKLMDFGSARYYTNEERQMSVILKQGFAPEEQYRRNGDQGPYTDVYALCATIYACITGSIPDDSLDRLANDTLKPPSKLGVRMLPHQERALMHGLALRAKDRTPDMDALIKEFNTPIKGQQAAMPVTRGTQPVRPVNTKPSYRPNNAPPQNQRQNVTTTPSYRPNTAANPAPRSNMTTNPTARQNTTTNPTARPHVTTNPTSRPHVTTTPTSRPNVTTTPSYRPNMTTNPTARPNVTTTPSYRPGMNTPPTQQPVTPQASNSGKSKKPLIIIIAILAVLIIGGIVTGIVVANNHSKSSSSSNKNDKHSISTDKGVFLIKDDAIDTTDSAAETKISSYLEEHPEVKNSMNNSSNGNGTGVVYARGNAMVYEFTVTSDVTEEQKSLLSSYLNIMKSSASSSLSSARSDTGVSNMVMVVAYLEKDGKLIDSAIIK